MKKPAAAKVSAETSTRRKRSKQPDETVLPEDSGHEKKAKKNGAQTDAEERAECEEIAEEEVPEEEDQIVDAGAGLEGKPNLQEAPEAKAPATPAPSQDESQRKKTENEGKEPDESPDLDFTNLSAKQLQKHQGYLSMVEKLKSGEISNADFLARLNPSQRTGFFHMMESRRTEEEKSQWQQLAGPGSKKKKELKLLDFLKGGLEESQVKSKVKMQQGWEENKNVAWVSWKQITDQYGEREAKQRIQKGLIKCRKDPKAQQVGLKVYQFLRIEDSVDYKKGVNKFTGTESSGGLENSHANYLSKGILAQEAGEESNEFFEDVWHGRKPKHKALMDEAPTDSESEEQASQETDVNDFLDALTGEPSSSQPKNREACNKAKHHKNEDKKTELTEKEKKAAELRKKKEEKEEARAQKVKQNEEKRKQKEQKWEADVDQLSSCEPSTWKKQVNKMLSMLNVEVRSSKATCKKFPEAADLKQSLDRMEQQRSALENVLVDGAELEEAQKLLAEGAALLRKNKLISKTLEA